MRALFLDVDRPIESRLLDPSTSEQIGQGALSRIAALSKPAREFSLKSWDALLRPQFEAIRNEIHAGRITGIFWLYLDSFGGDTEQPIFIGEGNGSQLEFPMPINSTFPSSWIIKVNQTTNTDWVITGDTLVFGSAPSGRITGYGKRKFKVMLTADNDAILGESEIYAGDDGKVGSVNPIILIEVEGVNVA